MNDKISDNNKRILEFIGENLQLTALAFQNGYFVAISEKIDMKLGTTAISLPISTDLGTRQAPSAKEQISFERKGITTATVIGSRNEIITRALAEKITLSTNSLVYLSVNFQENNEELFNEALMLVDSFIKKIT
ncbi:MAG: hypothetical protein FK730_06995 [Asgard group archaeon]|nr:hypothetical protein [Asgard group archaeon]